MDTLDTYTGPLSLGKSWEKHLQEVVRQRTKVDILLGFEHIGALGFPSVLLGRTGKRGPGSFSAKRLEMDWEVETERTLRLCHSWVTFSSCQRLTCQ